MTQESSVDALKSGMERLAKLTKSRDEARKHLDMFEGDTCKGMWRAIWGIEICLRGIALRKKDPEAKMPEDWRSI